MNTGRDFDGGANAPAARQRTPNNQASGLEKISFWFKALQGMSLWLKIWISVAFFACFGILFLVWRHAHGGTFTEVLYGMSRDQSREWIDTEILVGIPFDVWLIWFTFFSKNKLVTEDDKKCVILMFAGGAIGLLNLAFRYFRLR